MKATLVTCFFCFWVLVTNVLCANEIQIKFEDALDDEQDAIKKELISASDIQSSAKLINEMLVLEDNITFLFGGDDGPLFDPESFEILIPYHFIQEVEARFKKNDYKQKTGVKVKQAVQDALLHTMFHELGHALVVMYKLPVLGKEEDAVDALATLLLIESYENGQEIALSAADLFNLEDQDIDEFEEADFWDEHGLDAQRYYNTICQIYGSDPENYQNLLTENDIGEERGELCIEEYEQKVNGWMDVLDPYLKTQE